jgi:hypothetical protein
VKMRAVRELAEKTPSAWRASASVQAVGKSGTKVG